MAEGTRGGKRVSEVGPLVGGRLETRGVMAHWSAWLRQGEDEEVQRRLRLRTRTGRPLRDPASIARLEALSGRCPAPRQGGRPRNSPPP